MRRVLSRWLDALLGERCVCGQRVYPKDLADHERLEHAGDLPSRGEVWDEAADAVAEWMANNPGPTGIPHDPPRNPYAP